MERCEPLAYKKGISISAKKIPDIVLLGDQGYLEKMLVNLIRNSIIYGYQNGHTVFEFNHSTKGFVTIHVVDDGIGISKEDLPHIFERFYRADKFHRSGGKSIGLGLAIVKWVAEIHGGEVDVRNGKNKGTIFSITLPIQARKSINSL